MANTTEKRLPARDGWYPGVCKMCMQGDCVTRVHVIDGVVVKVEGDPRAPNNRGTLCPRGNSAIMNLYNPWRVKTPMKRTNPKKGLDQDPGFVEISWEEALQTVAARLKKVLEDDPKKLVVVSGFGQAGAYHSGLRPFLSAFKSPNDIPSRGSACAYHFGTEYVQGQRPDCVVDMDRCEYVINIGRSQGPNIAVASSGTRIYLDALERGTKIITVDPRCSPEASKATRWVPIRPGTDLAFLLGMLHVVLFEIGTIDVWFVKNRTNGPYLIGPNGYYVRDPLTLKPLLWDEVEGRARAFDEIPPMQSALEGTYEVAGLSCQPAFQLIKDSARRHPPEWAEKISTVPAETIRTIAREFVAHAHIGSTIVIDDFSFPFRPVGIQVERGAYQHTIEGVFADLVGKILLEMVGALDVPGGVTGNQSPGAIRLEPDADGVVKVRGEPAGVPWVWPPRAVDSRTFYPVSHTLVFNAAKAILDPDRYHLPYEPEILFTCGGNPIRSSFDREVFEAAYAKVPFSVALSLTFDEAAVMADIVLPEDSFMERDLHEPGPGFIMQPHKVMEEPTRSLRVFPWRDASAIRKPYDTRNVFEVLVDLAERIGILYGKDGYIDWLARFQAVELDINHRYTSREFAEQVVKQIWGEHHQIEEISDASGPVYKRLTHGKENYNYYYWPENKTRHPMYMIQLLKVGDDLRDNMEEAGLTSVPGWENNSEHFWQAFQPVPTWVPCPEFDAPAGYDLWAMNWKTPGFPFQCGDTTGNPWLHEVMGTFDPLEYAILINAETAKKKGLKDGDSIIVESRYGKTQGRLKTTQLMHPDAVGVPALHGSRSRMNNPIAGEGPYFNALCSIHERHAAVDPITGGIEEGPAVKVYKAGRR